MMKANHPKSSNQYSSRQQQTTPFEVDPELLTPQHNQIRRPSLPYGIIINDNPAGILIPFNQLVKAEWKIMPTEEELITIDLTEPVTGLFLRNVRILVLAFVPEYIRYKDIDENGELAGKFIGLYDEYRQTLDKKTQDVCSEHALIFLSSKNEALHKIPIMVRFKNVALWSFKSAREEFYHQLEKTFADYFQIEYSGKSNKWRSLGVLNIKFQAVKEGEGKNKSLCCKTGSITKPTPEKLSRLYLGKPEQKKIFWGLHQEIAGFLETGKSQLPALAKSGEPDELEELANNSYRSKNRSKPPRQMKQVEEFDAELDEWENFEAIEVDAEVDLED